MKTNLGFSSGSEMRCRSLGGVMFATALCAAMLASQNAAAQLAVESPALAQGRPNMLLPGGRAPAPMTVAMAPVPAAPAATPLRGPSCTGEIGEESNVVVAVGKSTLVPLSEPVRNRTLGNPAIAQATLVSPRTLYLVGMAVGTTNMIVQGRSGSCQMVNVIVNIDADGLQNSLRQLLPDESGIRVSTAAGNLVLTGHVSSAPAAQQAVEIAQAFAAAQPTQQQQSASVNSGNGTTSAMQQNTSSSKAADVINMMTVDTPQQVMLEVKVAEVSKTLMNQMGSALNIQGGFGSWSGALITSMLQGVGSAFLASKANNRPFNVAVDAQNTDQPVKILAEPNLVTISGQEASFLAGGKIFIPVPQSSGGGTSTITLQEEEFGVALKFTPTVLSGGRINLKVAPEVSELSPTGAQLTAPNVNGAAVLPLITTRRASTTVQMHDGETFAIGGLIKDNISGTLKAIPGIGEVPVLGALFRSTSFQQDRTELVFIITPHLVKPMRTADVPLPTDSFAKPNEVDVYATGVMEGRGGQVKVAPAGDAQHPTSAPAPAPAPVPPQQPVSSVAPVSTSRNGTDTTASGTGVEVAPVENNTVHVAAIDTAAHEQRDANAGTPDKAGQH